MNSLVEHPHRLVSVFLTQPGKTGIPDDSQKPPPPIHSAKVIEEAEGLEIRFLSQVLGVLRVTRDPSRQVVGSAQVRNDGVFETREPTGDHVSKISGLEAEVANEL